MMIPVISDPTTAFRGTEFAGKSRWRCPLWAVLVWCVADSGGLRERLPPTSVLAPLAKDLWAEVASGFHFSRNSDVQTSILQPSAIGTRH